MLTEVLAVPFFCLACGLSRHVLRTQVVHGMCVCPEDEEALGAGARCAYPEHVRCTLNGNCAMCTPTGIDPLKARLGAAQGRTSRSSAGCHALRTLPTGAQGLLLWCLLSASSIRGVGFTWWGPAVETRTAGPTAPLDQCALGPLASGHPCCLAVFCKGYVLPPLTTPPPARPATYPKANLAPSMARSWAPRAQVCVS